MNKIQLILKFDDSGEMTHLRDSLLRVMQHALSIETAYVADNKDFGKCIGVIKSLNEAIDNQTSTQAKFKISK